MPIKYVLLILGLFVALQIAVSILFEKSDYQIIQADNRTFLLDAKSGKTWTYNGISNANGVIQDYAWVPPEKFGTKEEMKNFYTQKNDTQPAK